jgi:hypothetical protein
MDRNERGILQGPAPKSSGSKLAAAVQLSGWWEDQLLSTSPKAGPTNTEQLEITNLTQFPPYTSFISDSPRCIIRGASSSESSSGEVDSSGLFRCIARESTHTKTVKIKATQNQTTTIIVNADPFWRQSIATIECADTRA